MGPMLGELALSRVSIYAPVGCVYRPFREAFPGKVRHGASGVTQGNRVAIRPVMSAGSGESGSRARFVIVHTTHSLHVSYVC